MKVAVITRPDNKSPKVLAMGIKAMFNKLSIACDIFYESSTLIRMQPLGQKLRYPFPFLKRVYSKLKFFKTERLFIDKLSNYDIIIISECTPNGFWKGYYAIEVLKEKLRKPILYYEVYYLGNTPTQIEKLMLEGEPCVDRYDWHLAVTDVTEIKSLQGNKWSRIGLNLEHAGLNPKVKKKFSVLVDFEQPGYEKYRAEQIEVLNELGIAYVSLEGKYKMEEIRYIYSESCVLLIQFPEAFGLPIAECLSCGAYILTPSSSWPMSWRINENPGVHTEGDLPDCFEVYSSKENLKSILKRLQLSYDLKNTPERVFSTFINYYPHFYFGELDALQDVIMKLVSKN